jgi:hypothetical protein
MNDVTVMSAVVVFVLGWYGLTLAGRALLKGYENSRLVWCPEVRSFSYVEVEESSHDGSLISVRHCSLWPQYRGCKSRCVN